MRTLQLSELLGQTPQRITSPFFVQDSSSKMGHRSSILWQHFHPLPPFLNHERVGCYFSLHTFDVSSPFSLLPPFPHHFSSPPHSLDNIYLDTSYVFALILYSFGSGIILVLIDFKLESLGYGLGSESLWWTDCAITENLSTAPIRWISHRGLLTQSYSFD